MATTYTTNYNLGKQENHADKFDMDVITDNADKIDAALTGLQSGIDGKQAALSTEQLAAVNSGITEEDVTQIGVNKNNISWNTENGVANVMPVVDSLSRSDSGLSYSISDDKYILSGSKTIDASYYVVSNTIALNPNTTYTIYIDHQNNSTTTQLQIVARSGDTWVDVSGGTTTGTSTINTGNYTRFMVRLFPNVSVGSAVNDTVRIMITPKSLGATSYQPYALSNAELTAKNAVNENNILLNARNGVGNYINSADVTISASGYVLNALDCNIPQGDYYLKYTSTQTVPGNIQATLKDANDTKVCDITTTSTSGANLIPITLTGTARKITIYSVRAGTYSNLQIIPKTLYDAGFTEYQPYAMSNAELTAAIQALQAQLNQ